MNFLGRNVPSFLKALLTQWMGSRITVTDTFPCPSISTAYSRIPVILLIAFILLFLMLLTEPSFRQLRTAGERTRTLWFPWHLLSPPNGHKKSPHRISSMKAYHLFCSHCNTITRNRYHSMSQSIHFHKFSKNIQCRIMEFIQMMDAVPHVHRDLFPRFKTQIPQFQKCLVLRIVHALN